MRLSEIVEGLAGRCRESIIIDPELRRRTITQYEEGTLDGIPRGAMVRVGWERPRSAERLRKDLNRLDRLAQQRFGASLPDDFRSLYETYGRFEMSIRWELNGEEDRAGCAWDWPATALRSFWLTEPAWEETHPDGSHHAIFRPIVPFMNTEGGEPVALVFRHAQPPEQLSVEWISPESFVTSEGACLYNGPGAAGGFRMWFAQWIEAGFSFTGSIE